MRYNLLKSRVPKSRREAVASKLLKLSKRLDKSIPEKDSDEHLLLATFNIRDFGKSRNRGFGKRLPESLFYLAEIISRFDFVAIQEVNELDDLKTTMQILGEDWDYIATDVTDSSLGGNGERLTYVFDRRKVEFQNIAGEIVLPNNMLISKSVVDTDAGRVHAGKQFRRTPFIGKFQSGWFKFEICTVHLYYGSESGPKLAQRIEEIERVAKYFGRRAEKAEKEHRSLILLGDFNIVHPGHKTMQALIDQGFEIPDGLGPSNVAGGKFYDQIAFRCCPGILDFVNSGSPSEPNCGVLDLFKNVFTTAQFDEYKDFAKKSPNGKTKTGRDLKKYYKQWRTYQISDHKPMWVRLRTNDSQKYLKSILDGSPTS